MAMSKVAAMSSLTEEQTNYLRFAYLMINISPKAVRVVFDMKFPPGGLHAVLNMYKRSLVQQKILNTAQIALLYPSQGRDNYLHTYFQRKNKNDLELNSNIIQDDSCLI